MLVSSSSSKMQSKGHLLMFATKKDIPCAILGLITMVIASVGSPIQTQIYGEAFEKLSKYVSGEYRSIGAFVSDIRLLCGLIMVVGVVRMVFTWVSIHVWLIVGERQQKRARKLLLTGLMRQNLEWYDSKENLMGTLAQVNRCIEEIRVATSENVALLVQGTSAIIFLLISAMISSWSLTLVIMASAPLMALSSVVFGKLTLRFASKENSSSAEASKVLDWCFVSGNLVRLLNGKYEDSVSFNRIVDSSAKAFTKMTLAICSSQSVLRTLSFLIFVQGFWFGSFMVSTGRLSIGQVFTAFSSCLLLGTHITTVASVLALLNKGQAAAATIASFMKKDDYFTLGDPDSAEKCFDPIVTGRRIRFDCVSFTHKNSEKQSLHDLSFELRNDNINFIIGPSGCGKSTLVSLLMKFYSPNCVSGFSTLIESKAIIFDKSLYENITLGCPNISLELVEEACEFAELGTFVRSLKNGIHSEVSTNLSGGQMQRLGIARAYVRDSPILILDEALSAIDFHTRRTLLRRIRAWRKGKMTVMISHNMSDIENNDSVLTLQAGKVREYEQYIPSSHDDKEVVNVNASIDDLIVHEKSESIFSSEETHNSREVNDLEAQGDQRDELKIKSVFSIFRDCFHTIPRKWIIGTSLMLSLISGVLTPVLSFCFSKLLSNIVNESAKASPPNHGAVFWSVLVIGLIIGDGIIYFMAHFLITFSSEAWIVKLRKKALVAINDQDMSFFTQKYMKPAELTALLMNDSRDLRNLISEFLPAALSLVALTLVGVIWSIVSGWKLALVGTSFVPLILLITISYGTILSRIEASYKNKIANIEKYNHNAVSGVKTVKAFGIADNLEKQMQEKLAEISSIAITRACFTGFGYSLSEMCTCIATAVILYYGLFLVARLEYTYESMLQVLTLLTFTMTSASTLMSSLPEIARGQRAGTLFAKLLSLTASSIETSGSKTALRLVRDGEPILNFRSVSFSYHDRQNDSYRRVLCNMSFEITKGSIVGIVGASGSGKSTVASLIGRLMDCDTGRISFNTQEIIEYDPQWYRRNIAIVPQHPKFFEGTVWENLTYGVEKPFLTKDFVIGYLKVCNMWDLIASLPYGMDTQLDERSVSSGQLQRLCIARALIREPKLIVFDECTSNLDRINTKMITELINFGITEANPQTTVVVITHDVEIMEQLPEILVLKNGRVDQRGKYADIAHQEGELNRLLSQH
ncbi:ATP-dependent permease [Candidozyma auris]